jgi:hypothetical protein
MEILVKVLNIQLPDETSGGNLRVTYSAERQFGISIEEAATTVPGDSFHETLAAEVRAAMGDPLGAKVSITGGPTWHG